MENWYNQEVPYWFYGTVTQMGAMDFPCLRTPLAGTPAFFSGVVLIPPPKLKLVDKVRRDDSYAFDKVLKTDTYAIMKVKNV